MAVRIALEMAGDEAGRSWWNGNTTFSQGELWEDTHTGCFVFPLSRCLRTETSVCVNSPATAEAGNG
jgi:hypothetical protein